MTIEEGAKDMEKNIKKGYYGMKKEKFDLSEWVTNDLRGDNQGIPTDAIKEFIRLLKVNYRFRILKIEKRMMIVRPTSKEKMILEELKDKFVEEIDKLAGDVLNGN